jgi:hypothetical protein
MLGFDVYAYVILPDKSSLCNYLPFLKRNGCLSNVSFASPTT